MEQLTVYRAQGKEIGLCFLFKYDLNGFLKAFEVAEGNMIEKQVLWLMRIPEGKDIPRFPAFEKDFKEQWQGNPDIMAKFDISVSPADLTFEAFYNAYGYKVKPELTRKAWEKLKEADRIKAFIALPKYTAHIALTGEGRAHPVTWINQKRWLDEYPEVFTPPAKQRVSKVFNNALQDLAKKKTEK